MASFSLFFQNSFEMFNFTSHFLVRNKTALSKKSKIFLITDLIIFFFYFFFLECNIIPVFCYHGYTDVTFDMETKSEFKTLPRNELSANIKGF